MIKVQLYWSYYARNNKCLTTTSHSGHVGISGVGVGVIGVLGQMSVMLVISQISEHIMVRQMPDPMGCMSNIVSPKSVKDEQISSEINTVNH